MIFSRIRLQKLDNTEDKFSKKSFEKVGSWHLGFEQEHCQQAEEGIEAWLLSW